MIQPVGRGPGSGTLLSAAAVPRVLRQNPNSRWTARRHPGAAQSKPRKQSLELPAAQLAVS